MRAMVRVLIAVNIVLLGAGCGSTADTPANSLSSGGGAVRSMSFVPVAIKSNPEALRALAEVRIEIERRGKSAQNANTAVLKLDKYIDESPEVAQFLVDEKIVDRMPNSDEVGNYHRHIKARSLQTLITSGQLERLPDYWNGIYSQPWALPYWYSIKFAVPVSRYVALSEPQSLRGAAAQRGLARYWLTGCETSFYAAGKSDPGVLGLVLKDKCSPSPDLVAAYYFMYAVNRSRDAGQKISLARELGDWYFSGKKYAEAAGWYQVVIGLGEGEASAILNSSSLEAFTRLYRPGGDIREAVRRAESISRAKLQGDVAVSVKRLQMIRDLGVPSIPAIRLPNADAL